MFTTNNVKHAHYTLDFTYLIPYITLNLKRKSKKMFKEQIKAKITLFDIDYLPEVLRLKASIVQILIYQLNGVTKSETARRLHLSYPTVTNITLRNDDYLAAYTVCTKLKLERAMDDSTDIFRDSRDLSIRAKETLADLMDGRGQGEEVPASVRAKCAMDLLAYGIGKPADKIELKSDINTDIVIHDETYDPFKDDPYIQNHPEKDAILKEHKDRAEKEMAEIEKE